MAHDQFKEPALRLLAYMREYNIQLPSDRRALNDPNIAQLAESLGFTLFMLGECIEYLVSRKLIIPARSQVLRRVGRAMRILSPVIYKVNPTPPQRSARPKPGARREHVSTNVSAVNLALSQSGTKTSAPPGPATQQVVQPEVPRKSVNIEAAIQNYAMAALTALRQRATGSSGWLALGVVDLERIVRDSAEGISRTQAKRLLSILQQLNLVRTCTADAGGCSHVQSEPAVILPAMLRQIGCAVEYTIEELNDRVALLEAALAAARKGAKLVLPQEVADSAQYYILAVA